MTESKKSSDIEGDPGVLSPNVSRAGSVIDSAPNNTFLGRAIADLNDEQGGRFGVAKAPATVIGAGPMPKLAGPQWSQDLAKLPDEPPLGFSVDAMEPIEASPAMLLRKHASELSAMLGSVDTFWSARLEKLLHTQLQWADEMERR
jgi:hypothetical protein